MKRLLILPMLACLAWAKGSIEIHGTSTFHDWTMVSHDVTVQMQKKGGVIEALTVSLPVESLKSGDAAMDNNAYKAFKVDPKTPITFTLFMLRPDGSMDGQITIGSRKKRVVVTPESIENGVISGSFKDTMSSYGVTPPTFPFGVMRTGDAIEIKYRVSE